jgi:hypothetical protein
MAHRKFSNRDLIVFLYSRALSSLTNNGQLAYVPQLKFNVTSIFAVVRIRYLQGRRCGLVVLVRARLVPQRVLLHRLDL